MSLALLLATALASTESSEPVDVLFRDRVDAFDAVERRVGPLPSSTLGVEFTVRSRGSTLTELPAVSTLRWPEPLTQAFVGATGLHEVDVVIEVAAKVSFDLWGLRGSYDIWSETLRLSASSPIAGLLLPGAPTTSVRVERVGAVLADYATSIDLGYDFSLHFEVDAAPSMSSTFVGRRIETGQTVIARYGETALHPIPDVDRRSLEVRAVYVGELRSKLDLLLRPRMSICDDYFGFCYTVSRFDVPISLVDSVDERSFGKDFLRFPLPVIQLRRLGHHFDGVVVGDEAAHVLEVRNDGHLDLQVELLIEGDSAFDVVPPRLVVPARDVGLATVYFTPREVGSAQAELWLASNDPDTPELVFALSGLGEPPPPDPEPDPEDPGGDGSGSGSSFTDDGSGVSELRSCGCASTAPLSGGLGFLAVGVTFLLRRRRPVDGRARSR